MNKQLSNIAGDLHISQDHIPLVKSPTINKNFPEFKRHEYDEGHLKKDLIYFNQINANFTKTLGRSFINLMAFHEEFAINPTLLQTMKASLCDTQFTNEEFKRKTTETAQFLEKIVIKDQKIAINDQENSMKALIEILRIGLLKEGISLIYSKDKEFLTSNLKKSWSQVQKQEIQKFSVLNMALLAANYLKEYIVIEFKDSEKYNFGSLSAEIPLREKFLEEISEEIRGILDKKHISNEKITIIPARIEKNEKNSFKIYMVLPEIAAENLANIVFSLDSLLKIKYAETFSTIERSLLLRIFQVSDEDFNLWGNREYREAIKDSNVFLAGNLGGRPYYKPSNGWKRYAFDISSFDLTGDLWLNGEKSDKNGENVDNCDKYRENGKKNHDKNEVNGKKNEVTETQWANGYVNIMNFLVKNSSLIEKCEDIGPNKEKFSEKLCGKGIIFSDKLENFMIKNGIQPVIRTCPIEYDNKWFLMVLQCRVRPESIRTPKSFNNGYYIVNDPKDLRANGLLVKEIDKKEAETYFS